MPADTSSLTPAISTPPSPARPTSFKRVLLKLSGEAFCRPGGFGIDVEELEVIGHELQALSLIHI